MLGEPWIHWVEIKEELISCELQEDYPANYTGWPLMRLLLLRLMHSQLIHIKMESIQIDRCFEIPSLQVFSVPKDSVIWDCLLPLCFEKTKKLSVCGVGSHYTSLLRSFLMFISYQEFVKTFYLLQHSVREGRFEKKLPEHYCHFVCYQNS